MALWALDKRRFGPHAAHEKMHQMNIGNRDVIGRSSLYGLRTLVVVDLLTALTYRHMTAERCWYTQNMCQEGNGAVKKCVCVNFG